MRDKGQCDCAYLPSPYDFPESDLTFGERGLRGGAVESARRDGGVPPVPASTRDASPSASPTH